LARAKRKAREEQKEEWEEQYAAYKLTIMAAIICTVLAGASRAPLAFYVSVIATLIAWSWCVIRLMQDGLLAESFQRACGLLVRAVGFFLLLFTLWCALVPWFTIWLIADSASVLFKPQRPGPVFWIIALFSYVLFAASYPNGLNDPATLNCVSLFVFYWFSVTLLTRALRSWKSGAS
jgi:hypothetical protein